MKLLAVFAHPDDEAFGTGGTLAHYAAAGADVTLVCATRGEVGEIADESLATPETLGSVRENELRCAAGILGISNLIFLGYRDSGMEGTPENCHERAFINAPAGQVIQQLVGIIRRVQPDVIVTFEPNGGYGHPDHIAIHKHTVAAFHASADAELYPDQGQPWQAARLFYTAIPKSFFIDLRDQMIALDIDTGDFARFEEHGIGWPDDEINVALNVAAHIEAKWAALNCHRTQFGPNNLFHRLPDKVMKQKMSLEHFALAWPQPEPGLQMASLFSGLDNK